MTEKEISSSVGWDGCRDTVKNNKSYQALLGVSINFASKVCKVRLWSWKSQGHKKYYSYAQLSCPLGWQSFTGTALAVGRDKKPWEQVVLMADINIYKNAMHEAVDQMLHDL